MKRTPSSLSGSPLAPKYGEGASSILTAAGGRAGNPSSTAARRGGATGGGDGGIRGSPSPFSLRRPALSASGSAGDSPGGDDGVPSGAGAGAGDGGGGGGGGSERDGSGTTDSSVGSGILTAADILAYRATSSSTRKGSLHAGQSRFAHRQRHEDQSAHGHLPRHRQQKSLDDRESLSFRQGFRHGPGLGGSPSSNRVAQPSKEAAAAKSAHRPAAVAATTDAASSAGSVASDSSDVSTRASESASASRRGGHASPRAKPMDARHNSSSSLWRSPSASFPSPPASSAAAASAGAKSRGEAGASPLSARAPQQAAARAMMLRRSRSFSTFSRPPATGAPATTGAIAGASSADGSNSGAHSACSSAVSACASGGKQNERDGGGGSTSTSNKLLRSHSVEGSCDVGGESAGDSNALFGRAGASARRAGLAWNVVDAQMADWGLLAGIGATGDAPRADSGPAASARTARSARAGSGASERNGSTPTGSRPALSRSRSGLSTAVFRRLSFSCEGDEATGEECGLVTESHSEEEQEGEGTGGGSARTTALAASDYDELYGTGRVARGDMASRGLDCRWWDKIRDELDALRALVEESASTAARSHPAATTAATVAPPQASPGQDHRQSPRLRRGMLKPSTKGDEQAPLLATNAGGGAVLAWLGHARRELESIVGGRAGGQTATEAAAGETKEGAVEAAEGAAGDSESVDAASLQQATLPARSITEDTAPHAQAHLPAPVPPALRTPAALPSAGGWLGRPRGKPSGAGLIGARAAGGGGKRAGEVVLLGRGKEEHLENHMVVSDLQLRLFVLGFPTFLFLAACEELSYHGSGFTSLPALSSPPTLLPHSLSSSVSPCPVAPVNLLRPTMSRGSGRGRGGTYTCWACHRRTKALPWGMHKALPWGMHKAPVSPVGPTKARTRGKLMALLRLNAWD
ncbi:unnamed protein product [Closterium sp. NIES-64]|nr:unnamed protein product [Closterium sp. NIES-64]